MLETSVISRVYQPTDWCTPMVVTPKSNGRVRVCVHLSKLNEYVKRENHPIPVVGTSLGRLGGSKVFSTWPKLRILANKTSVGIKTTDNIHRSTGPFLPQRVALRDQLWFPELSEEYESDPPGIRWRGVQHRWRFSLRKRPDCTWSEVGSSTHASGWSWRDTQPKKNASSAQIESSSLEMRYILKSYKQLQTYCHRRTCKKWEHFFRWWINSASFQMISLTKDLLHKVSQFTRAPVLALYNPSKETNGATDASSFSLGGVIFQL